MNDEVQQIGPPADHTPTAPGTAVVGAGQRQREPGIYPAEFVREHPGIFVSGVVLATVVFKLLSVAHGSAETVAALLQATGAVDVGLAALLMGARSLSVVLVVFAIPQFGEAIRERDPLLVPGVVLLVSIVAAAVLVPWHALVALALPLAFWAISSVIWAERDRREGKRLLGPRNVPNRWQATVMGVLGLAIAWAVIAFSDRPWLPTEQLTLDGGDQVVGYVIEENDDDILFLREPQRIVERLETATVDTRVFCTMDASDPRPLILRMMGMERPVYPECKAID